MMAIQRVLCPVDLSDNSRRAVEHAAAISRAWNAHLSVLHVSSVPLSLGPEPFVPPISTEQELEALRLTVRDFAQAAAGDVSFTVRVTSATDVRRAIVTEVESDDADFLVIGAHGHTGVERFLLGSTTDRVVRQAGCPVLVVPANAEAPQHGQFRRILCGVDFSSASLRAFRYAIHLADRDGEVRLLHAIEMPPELRERQIVAAHDVDAVRMAAEKAAHQRLQALFPGADAPPVRIAAQVAEGRAHRQILELARQEGADLIVLGARGRGAVDRWLFGSNTQAVLNDAPCAVLTVRPE